MVCGWGGVLRVGPRGMMARPYGTGCHGQAWAKHSGECAGVCNGDEGKWRGGLGAVDGGAEVRGMAPVDSDVADRNW